MSTSSPAMAFAAQKIATAVQTKLDAIERLLRRQLELAESSEKNFLGVGTVAGGGTVGQAATQLFNGNPNRRGLSVQNIGAAGNLTVGLGTQAPIANTGITLAPGQSWDGRVSGQMWKGSISVIGSAAGVVYTWLYA